MSWHDPAGPGPRRRRFPHVLAATLVVLSACGADANPGSFRSPPPTTRALPAVVATTAPGTVAAAPAGPGSAATTSAPFDGASTSAPSDPATTSAPSDPATTAPLEAAFVTIGEVQVVADTVAVARSPVDLAVRPGDNALYVVEHAGRVVRVLDDETRVVADLTDRLVGHRNEQGLTGLEFSADGAVAWIHYTEPTGATTVSEVSFDDAGDLDLATERVMIRWSDPPAVNHNSGDLLLAPDGSLLITLGDGHNSNDPYRFAGDPTTLRGSILRVMPTPTGDVPYEIPEDNPFADGTLETPDGRTVTGAPEVFAWGLRNPWKIDLDPLTGSLWIADVGSADAEEINAVFPADGRPAGWAADFGWSRLEGTLPLNDDVEPLLGESIDPVFSYDHAGIRCAISGGVVYRGDAIPELRSGYVFADFCEGSIWVFDWTTGETRRLIGRPGGEGGIPAVTGVRTGPDGELYVLSLEGGIRRLEPG